MVEIDLTKYFLAETKKDLYFRPALNLIKKISSGNIWVIGGYVSKSIIRNLYNTEIKSTDYDFIVEKLDLSKLPKNIALEKTSFGQPRIKYKDSHIDVVELSEVHSIKSRFMLPIIDNFFWGTPLNIQAIAFDVNNNKIIGQIGINAILAKEIKINNKELADEYFSKECFVKEKYTIKEYAKKHADRLNFKLVLD